MKRLVAIALCVSIPFTGSVLAHAQSASEAQAKPPTKLPPKAPKEQPAASPGAPQAQAPTPTPPKNEGGTADKERVRLSSNRMKINYGYPAWNKSSSKIDSASLLLREGTSGKLVQINLDETAPDSSIFSGIFLVNWTDLDRVQPEFYIPPQELLQSPEGLKRLGAMIANKEMARKPFILRRTTNEQSIELFDSREQALAAIKAYQAEQQIQQTPAIAPQRPTEAQAKKFPSDEQLELQRRAEEKRAAEEAARLATERVRLEQVEARRLADLAAAAARMSAEAQAQRKQEAARFAKEGLELYQREQYAEARPKFDRAVELDPENHSYYFQYGVTLYRLDDYNRSIVFLRLVDDPAVNIERNYFLALNFYKQKNQKVALEEFDKVIVANHPEISPSANFYKGVILAEMQEWEGARNAFQAVLDTSKDPKLDERAEAYLEQILRMQQVAAERERKWVLSVTLGEMYDSNVLLISDASLDQGAATNSAGYRTLFNGSVKYRPIYEATYELATQLDFLTMYSVDSSFVGDQSIRNTDPTVASLTVPYTYKGLIFGRGYKFDFVPGYETIYMSIEENQTKEILSSLMMSFNNLVIMSESLFSSFNIEIRKDTAKLTSSTGDNDSSAIKVKLSNGNLIFLDEKKSRILQADGAYTMNMAQGRNATFSRFDLSVGYIQPFYWETAANAKLGMYLVNYPEHTSTRSDTNFTLTTGLSKKLNDTWTTGLLGSYSTNSSNIQGNQYKKFSGMLTLSGSWSL